MTRLGGLYGFRGGGGNDVLRGGASREVLSGGSGNDLLDGGRGRNVYVGKGGADTIHDEEGRAGIYGLQGDGDVAHGGPSSHDRVMYAGAAVIVDLSAHIGGHLDDAIQDQIFGVEIVWGTEQADHLIGDEGPNSFLGQGGEDVLDLSSGDDEAHGGRGKDTISGGNGLDRLLGDDGLDRLLGDAGNDALTGGSDDDHLDGGDGTDSLDGGSGTDVCLKGETIAGFEEPGPASAPQLDALRHRSAPSGCPCAAPAPGDVRRADGWNGDREHMAPGFDGGVEPVNDGLDLTRRGASGRQEQIAGLSSGATRHARCDA